MSLITFLVLLGIHLESLGRCQQEENEMPMRIAVKGLKELQPKQQAHCGHLWTSVDICGHLWTSVDICHGDTLQSDMVQTGGSSDSGGPLIYCCLEDVNGEVVHRSRMSALMTKRLRG